MAAPRGAVRGCILAIQGRRQECFRLLTQPCGRTRRSEPSLCKHTRAPSTLSDHDSPAKEKTRRRARGLVGRRNLVRGGPQTFGHRRGSASGCCLCCEQGAAASRAQTLGYDAWGIAFVQLYAAEARRPAITRPTPRNPTISTDKPVKPNRHTRIDGGSSAERRGPAPPADEDAERVESRRIQASAGLGAASAVLTSYQVRHVCRESARDRARAVLRRGAVQEVEEIATTAATTIQ